MARKESPRYIRFYTDGSAARQLELPQKPRTSPKPKRAGKQKVLRLDGLVVIGLAVAAVMALCLAVGSFRMSRAEYELNALENYVNQLEAENQSLKTEYANGYSLPEVRVAAEAMGLVPMDEVRHITLDIPEPVVEEEPSWWQQLLEDFKSLFA